MNNYNCHHNVMKIINNQWLYSGNLHSINRVKLLYVMEILKTCKANCCRLTYLHLSKALSEHKRLLTIYVNIYKLLNNFCYVGIS